MEGKKGKERGDCDCSCSCSYRWMRYLLNERISIVSWYDRLFLDAEVVGDILGESFFSFIIIFFFFGPRPAFQSTEFCLIGGFVFPLENFNTFDYHQLAFYQYFKNVGLNSTISNTFWEGDGRFGVCLRT